MIAATTHCAITSFSVGRTHELKSIGNPKCILWSTQYCTCNKVTASTVECYAAASVATLLFAAVLRKQHTHTVLSNDVIVLILSVTTCIEMPIRCAKSCMSPFSRLSNSSSSR